MDWSNTKFLLHFLSVPNMTQSLGGLRDVRQEQVVQVNYTWQLYIYDWGFAPKHYTAEPMKSE